MKYHWPRSISLTPTSLSPPSLGTHSTEGKEGENAMFNFIRPRAKL